MTLTLSLTAPLHNSRSMTHSLLRSDVARILGVSPTRVQQLDEELKPQRGENGWRRYSLEDVERVRASRKKGTP